MELIETAGFRGGHLMLAAFSPGDSALGAELEVDFQAVIDQALEYAAWLLENTVDELQRQYGRGRAGRGGFYYETGKIVAFRGYRFVIEAALEIDAQLEDTLELEEDVDLVVWGAARHARRLFDPATHADIAAISNRIYEQAYEPDVGKYHLGPQVNPRALAQLRRELGEDVGEAYTGDVRVAPNTYPE